MFHDTEHQLFQYIKHNHKKIIKKKYSGHAKDISAWNLLKSKDIPASEKIHWSLHKKKSVQGVNPQKL